MRMTKSYSPLFRELDRMNREFDRMWAGFVRSSTELTWNVDENEVVVSAELPGVATDDIKLTVEKGNVLSLSATRATTIEDEDAEFLRRERRSGTWQRTLRLPYSVDSEAVSADFVNGILTVTLPRAEADKPRQIAVSAA